MANRLGTPVSRPARAALRAAHVATPRVLTAQPTGTAILQTDMVAHWLGTPVSRPAPLRDVHRARGDYRCIIDELVTDGDRAAARMRFTGKHRAEFLGAAATSRQIAWAGAAFCRCAGGRNADLWCSGA